MKQKFLLLVAVIFGIMAFVLNYSQINAERKKIQDSTEEVVLIKLKNSKAQGQTISADDLVAQKISRPRGVRGLERDIPWSSRDRLYGRTLDISKDAGELLQWTDIAQTFTRASGVTAKIKKNFRAVSISVDSISSVNNLIRPGDNVDVIGTFRFPEMRGDNSLDTLTLTILQNVRVLATGAQWETNYGLSDGGSARSGYSTVTLELTPKEVEMIIFASQKGKLTLSLRNYEESSFTQDLQSVNFRYLEQNIPKYNEERQGRQSR